MATRPSLLPRWAETILGVASSYIQLPPSYKLDVGFKDNEQPPAGFLNWLLNDVYRWIKYIDEQAGVSRFGFGSDGALTFDGVSTVLGIIPSGSTYTVPRHLFPTNMSVSSGVTIYTNGFGIWGTGVLTMSGTSKLDDSGGDAAAEVAGASRLSGIWFGGAGTTGGNAASNGNNATLLNSCIPSGAGGAGGAGSGGATGGTSTSTRAAAEKGSIYVPDSFSSGMLFGATGLTVPTAGCGGGSGAGSGGGAKGGGGGAGGGFILVMFRSVNLSASCNVWARGGAGGNGQSGGGFAAGGGGGGQGGTVLFGYRENLGTSPSTRISVAGGNGGTGHVAGGAGSAGLALVLAI